MAFPSVPPTDRYLESGFCLIPQFWTELPNKATVFADIGNWPQTPLITSKYYSV
jgi:hypothetical protein